MLVCEPRRQRGRRKKKKRLYAISRRSLALRVESLLLLRWEGGMYTVWLHGLYRFARGEVEAHGGGGGFSVPLLRRRDQLEGRNSETCCMQHRGGDANSMSETVDAARAARGAHMNKKETRTHMRNCLVSLTLRSSSRSGSGFSDMGVGSEMDDGGLWCPFGWSWLLCHPVSPVARARGRSVTLSLRGVRGRAHERSCLTLSILAWSEPCLSTRVPIRMSVRGVQNISAACSIKVTVRLCSRRPGESTHQSQPEAVRRAKDGQDLARLSQARVRPSTHAAHCVHGLVAVLDDLHDGAVLAFDAGAVCVESMRCQCRLNKGEDWGKGTHSRGAVSPQGDQDETVSARS